MGKCCIGCRAPIDFEIQEVMDNPLLVEVDELLIFAKKNSDGTCTILAGPQGRLKCKDGEVSSLKREAFIMPTGKVLFEEKWKNERRQGLRGYHMKHVGAILAMVIGVVAGDSIAHKRLRFEFLIITIIIACFFQADSWVMNEMHYKI